MKEEPYKTGEISPRMRRLLEKGREEARQKVIDRGIIQFRADPDLMRQLMEISERRRIPLGTMLREWISDRLQEESNSSIESANEYESLRAEMRDGFAEIISVIRQGKRAV